MTSTRPLGLDVNDMVQRLLSVGFPDKGLTKTINSEEIETLIDMAREIFKSQPVLIEINPPVKVCGDTHGQYGDVLRLFQMGGFPPAANYLFLGDYVDRGKQSLEAILLLLCYKVKYPKNFFILRGNHECAHVNRVYGFYDECMRRFNSARMWEAFQTMFTYMPLCGLIGNRILCMHGGLSPHLKSIDLVRNIQRPTEAKGITLEMDLLWADPVAGQTGFQANVRGGSVGFGADVLAKFCKEFDIDLVARAHQVVQDGYEFFGGRKCVTIFSAPLYCGQFDNCAAMMVVDENLLCSFQILRPMTGNPQAKQVPTQADTSEMKTCGI